MYPLDRKAVLTFLEKKTKIYLLRIGVVKFMHISIHLHMFMLALSMYVFTYIDLLHPCT